VAWLLKQQVPHEQRLEQLREAAYGLCRGNRREPPTPDRLEWLIRWRGGPMRNACAAGCGYGSGPRGLARLDGLVAASPEDGSEAGQDGRSALAAPGDVFAGVDHSSVELHRQRATVGPPSELRAHPAPIRATLLD